IARKLGFKNFTELGYLRMARGDYNATMVKQYRDQVHKYVVPLATEIRERQAKRLKLDKLKYYDESLLFTNGNAQPKGDEEWMLKQAGKMYNELAGETGVFFDFMMKSNLLDLPHARIKHRVDIVVFYPNIKAHLFLPILMAPCTMLRCLPTRPDMPFRDIAAVI